MDAPRSPILVTDPRLFGRRGVAPFSAIESKPNLIGEDLRLFAMTFAAGFLFMSVFLA
jgi:hypothetical protein